MSFIPFERLANASSLELKRYQITKNLDDKEFFLLDSASEYLAFWTSCIIRNFGANENIFYRQTRVAEYDALPPNSERKVEGWGSFIELRAPAGQNMTGVAIFSMVNFEDAVRTPGT